jgi:hypothetical protein
MNLQKVPMVRSKAIREAAEGEICTWPGCDSANGVVPAHSNMSIHGKAGGQKAHDCFVAFLCHQHHNYYDNEPEKPYAYKSASGDKEWNFMRAMSKTQMRLIALRIITINGTK